MRAVVVVRAERESLAVAPFMHDACRQTVMKTCDINHLFT